MQLGSYAIANDLLGVVVGFEGNKTLMRDKTGVLRKVKSKACHEISNPHALAFMVYDRTCKAVLNNRNKSS